MKENTTRQNPFRVSFSYQQVSNDKHVPEFCTFQTKPDFYVELGGKK
jgi:hypothetical protein